MIFLHNMIPLIILHKKVLIFVTIINIEKCLYFRNGWVFDLYL